MSGLTVRLTGEGTPTAMITRLVSDLRFKSVDPGGFASVSVRLRRSLTAEDLDAFSHLSIFDAETGEIVADGRLVDPGRSADASGQVWSLSAVGEGLAAMQDRKQPYILIDSRLDAWYQAYRSSKNLSWSVGDLPDGTAQGLLMRVDGTTIAAGKRSDVRYYPIYYSGQTLGGYGYKHIEGRNSSNSRLMAYASNKDDTTFDITHDQTWSDSSLVTVAASVGTHWSSSNRRDNVFLRYRRDTLLSDAGENDWCHVRDTFVSAARANRVNAAAPDLFGTDYTVPWLLASDAFVDLFANCSTLDWLNADITTSVHQFNQLAWPQGVTPYQAAEEILRTEPEFTWAGWERQRNGKWRVEYRARPTTPRYEITALGGYSENGDTTRYLDAVWVTGSDKAGHPIAQQVAWVNPGPRSTYNVDTIELGNDNWSPEAADAVGFAALEESLLKATGARAVLDRLVFDNYHGRFVAPWMVRAGELCRVRGVSPRVNAMNPNPNVDSTVFRIVSSEYSAMSGTTELELNSYTLTEARALAQLVGAGKR